MHPAALFEIYHRVHREHGDLISDDPRKARYVRTLLDAVMQDERLAGDLVLVAAPLEEEDDGEQN